MSFVISWLWVPGSALRAAPGRPASMNLKQPRRAHAAADAHGDHGVLGTAPLALDQDVAAHARTAHAERMADRDRAAVHVELLHRNAEPVAAIEHLGRKRLV